MTAPEPVHPLQRGWWADAGEQAIHDTAIQNNVQPYVIDIDGVPDEGIRIWLYTSTDGLVEGIVRYSQDPDRDDYLDTPLGDFELFGSRIYFTSDPNIPLQRAWTPTSLTNAPNIGNIQVSNTNVNGIGMDEFINGEPVYKLNTHVFKRPALNSWWATITQQRQQALVAGNPPGPYRNPTTGLPPTRIEKGVARVQAAAPAAPQPAAPAPAAAAQRRTRRGRKIQRGGWGRENADFQAAKPIIDRTIEIIGEQLYDALTALGIEIPPGNRADWGKMLFFPGYGSPDIERIHQRLLDSVPRRDDGNYSVAKFTVIEPGTLFYRRQPEADFASQIRTRFFNYSGRVDPGEAEGTRVSFLQAPRPPLTQPYYDGVIKEFGKQFFTIRVTEPLLIFHLPDSIPSYVESSVRYWIDYQMGSIPYIDGYTIDFLKWNPNDIYKNLPSLPGFRELVLRQAAKKMEVVSVVQDPPAAAAPVAARTAKSLGLPYFADPVPAGLGKKLSVDELEIGKPVHVWAVGMWTSGKITDIKRGANGAPTNITVDNGYLISVQYTIYENTLSSGGGRRHRRQRKSMKKRKTHSHKKVDLRLRRRTRVRRA